MVGSACEIMGRLRTFAGWWKGKSQYIVSQSLAELEDCGEDA